MLTAYGIWRHARICRSWRTAGGGRGGPMREVGGGYAQRARCRAWQLCDKGKKGRLDTTTIIWRFRLTMSSRRCRRLVLILARVAQRHAKPLFSLNHSLPCSFSSRSSTDFFLRPSRSPAGALNGQTHPCHASGQRRLQIRLTWSQLQSMAADRQSTEKQQCSGTTRLNTPHSRTHLRRPAFVQNMTSGNWRPNASNQQLISCLRMALNG